MRMCLFKSVIDFKKPKKYLCKRDYPDKLGKILPKGRTRIRTGVGRIKTDSDNHYTIQPSRIRNFAP